ncbi:MAG: dynamin family protein [Pseudomonadota bacterium]
MSVIEPNLRKPCIALMGEFSAGKSTLANLLIGADPLPVQVVATQLPPVWIAYGDKDPIRVDLDGNMHAIDINNLAAARLDETTYIKIFYQEDVLMHCDLLDLPGISDPNMSAEVWERMMSMVHGVLWCSHATQAWRQSEAAVWESLPRTLYQHSLLLLTRADKLTSERDLQRVVRRVRAETKGLFVDCLPISLLQATSEQDDYDVWLKSGAGEFAKLFAGLLEGLSAKMADTGAQSETAQPLNEMRMPAFEGPAPPEPETPALAEPAGARITPRRVRAPDRSS